MIPQPLRKRFGQHFLRDQTVIADILQLLAAKPEETLVEIGPGAGALTLPLLAQGLSLTVIELDKDIAAWWQDNYPQVRVFAQDVLTVDFSALTSLPLRIFGNLPYNISTPLLFHLTQQRAVIRDMLFMLQAEVVERLVAEPGSKSYGRLSVVLQLIWEMTPAFYVSPQAFEPPPKVESAVLTFRPHARCAPALLPLVEHLAHVAFQQRRKTLRNALSAVYGHVLPQFAEVVDVGLRPEALSPEDFCRMAAVLAAS